MSESRFRSTLAVLGDISSIVAAIAIVAVAVFMLNARRGASPPAASLAARHEGGVSQIQPTISRISAKTFARPGARLALVEFSDFECPYCRQYALVTHDRVMREFVDSGRLAYSFRHFPSNRLHPHARMGAQAAECAESQGRFWILYSALFTAVGASTTTASLTDLAADLGLDRNMFATCISGAAQPAIADDESEARRLGVSGTPTFFLGELGENGRLTLTYKILGAAPFSSFQDTVQALSERK